jgi:trimethylamine---corrinoid protein Co-methyltransferase
MQPYTQVLSQDEIHMIHMDSLEMLEKIGLEVKHQESLELLERAGAIVDWKAKRVFMPVHLINETLAKCRPSVSLYNSDGTRSMVVGGNNVYFGTVGFATNVLDWRTGEIRDATLQDYEEIVKLAEVLDFPQFILPPAQPTDVPVEKSDRYQAKVGLLTTRKPLILQSYGAKEARDIIQMAAETVGGMDRLQAKPNIAMLVCITSPLTIRDDACETIIETAKAGIPLFIESGPMAGATSPVTLASTVALANAEILSNIVLAKLVNPMVPVVYASWARIIDMRFGNVSLGCPEFGLMRIATSQMAKFYNLPSGGGGTLTDSNALDTQLGYDKMVTAILPALGRTNMILGMGIIGQENTLSCECLLVDSEVAMYVDRVLKGIKVDEERLGYEVIEKTVAGETSFIGDPLTMKYYRDEHLLPRLTDRSVPTEWKNQGSKDTGFRARELVEKLLKKYQRPPLPAGLEEKLDKIMMDE